MKPFGSHNRQEEITPPSQVRIQSVPNPYSDLLTYNKRAQKGTLSAAMRESKGFFHKSLTSRDYDWRILFLLRFAHTTGFVLLSQFCVGQINKEK